MDSKTHILFAVKLLELCGCDKSAAVYSIIPTIDKDKPCFAGLYAHQ